jgi:CHAD domain-containing protein
MPPLDGETPLAEAARHALALRLGDLERELAALAAERSVDGVHDSRVATRRLRAALKLAEAGTEARVEVKRLGDALGQVRDLDVRIEWLSELLAGDLPADARAGIERLVADERELLPPREAELVSALERFRAEVVARLRKAFERLAPSGKLGGKPIEALRKSLRGLRVAVDDVIAQDDPHTAHQLRIRAKKLRYDGELVKSARPAEVQAMLDALVPLQKILGDLHDCDVRHPLVDRLLVRAAVEERPGAIHLLGLALADRDRLAGQLAQVLSKWRAEELVRSLRARLK